MAQIIYEHHEDITRALVEAALETREVGYTDAASYQELIIKIEAGSYRHFPSLERLDDAAAAISSGAALIGFFPPSGLVATTVQAALEEIFAAGGSSVLGSGSANSIAMWQSGTTLANSSLSEVGGKILFNGDSVANFWRFTAGHLVTDGILTVTGDLNVLDDLAVTGTADVSETFTANAYSLLGALYVLDTNSASGSAIAKVAGQISKNDTVTKEFYGLLIKPVINNGASNTNTTLNVLEIDTTNTDVTGMTVNLLKLSYGGSQMARLDSNGDLYTTRDIITGRNLTIQNEITAGVSLAFISEGDGKVGNYFTTAIQKNDANTRTWILNLFEAVINSGASNTTTTLDILKVDTVNTDTTGIVTVNLLRMFFGASEKYRFQHNGTFYVMDGTAQMYLYSTGAPGDTNYEYGQIAKGASSLQIATAAGGTGTARYIQLIAGAAAAVTVHQTGNLSFWGNFNFGDGVGVLLLPDAGTVPTTNPTNGVLIYSEGGVLKTRDSSGTVVSLV